MTVSPNLKVLNDWRSSLNVAFSVLRRILFLTTDDFEFGDFDPNFNRNGMTVTTLMLRRSRYVRVLNFMWISFYAEMTLAAPLADRVFITIPGTAAGDDINTQQAAGLRIVNNGNEEVGSARIRGSESQLILQRMGGAFTAGFAIFNVNMFIEVI